MSKNRLYFQISLTVICLLITGTWSFAQEIKNAHATLDSGKVLVTYDLISDKEDYSYEVNIFSSSNNFRSPLSKVSGDVGKNVQPGNNKTVIWDAEAELVKYLGEVTIRVDVQVIAPFISFQSPGSGDSFKRGKSQNIQWTGGPNSGNMKIELMQGNNTIEVVGNAPNTGSYTWEIPGNLKPGNYKVKFSQSNNAATSKEFSIKRKIPLGIKLLPLVVVGGVAAMLVGGGSGGEETPPIETGIPDPPDLQ